MLDETDDPVDVYDSTDSYAALFFELFWNYYVATSDDSFMLDTDNKDIIDTILICFKAAYSGTPRCKAYLTDRGFRGAVRGNSNNQKEFLIVL